MKSIRNIFSQVALPKIGSSSFDLSHDVKMSTRMGLLTPTCCMEVIPGDKINIAVENMLRFAPLVSPVMHRVKVVTDYYFVPNRLLWPQWDKFITGDPSSPLQYVAPYCSVNSVEKGSLADYLGVPITTSPLPSAVNVSPMAIAAYLLIWDEYYRDQNLQGARFVPLLPGQNTYYNNWFNLKPLRRAWEHDYFTSALPFSQKGNPVTIPVFMDDDGQVDVKLRANSGPSRFTAMDGNNTLTGQLLTINGEVGESNTGYRGVIDPNGSLYVEPSVADINMLRRAFRLQEFLERTARGGSRYVESILSHFGVKSSDARLQRPEFIGRSRQNMVISEVLATAQNSDDNVAIGQMAGHGISVGGASGFNFRAEEHGFVIGLLNVQPETAYQDGLHRQWTRFDRLDYAWPSFANLGEQEIKNKELYMRSSDPEGTFGYIPRYSEYKYACSRVAGDMRSTLSYWHLGRILNSEPLLNEQFVSCNPSDRIFSVTDPNEDHLYCHIFNKITAVRKLPRFGVPTI